jgi:hypothetical protein
MALQPLSPRRGHRPRQLLRRLDRTVSRLNPYLLAIAIGIGILYVTCLVALLVRLPVVHLNACVRTPDSSATGDIQPDRDSR